MRLGIIGLACLSLTLMSCGSGRPYPATSQPDGRFDLLLLQLNDVYEIQPIGGGRWGGLARVASLREELLRENPNTLALLAGDFLSPSALGTARVDGERLAGRQMVAVLNAMGLDVVTFGNHEFDVSEQQLLARIGESGFRWTSANVRRADGSPFPGVSQREIVRLEEPDGDRLRLGIIGVTLGDNVKDYVSYLPPIETLAAAAASLRDSVDVLVALTHLTYGLDQRAAERIPEIDLILGGHDHENLLYRRGESNTPIAKADANARSVFVHRVRFERSTSSVTVEPRFVEVNERIPYHTPTQSVVDEWLAKGFSGFVADGFDPAGVVAVTTEPLDGLEASVRNRPTALTQRIAEGMRTAVPGAEMAVFNSGSVRIDDVIQPGEVTEYDVIRVLPFGGTILSVDVDGELLDRLLRRGAELLGEGGYLQTTPNVSLRENVWYLDGDPLQPGRPYRIAVNDYLANGLQPGISFFNTATPGLTIRGEYGDIRRALIEALRSRYGADGG